VQAQRAKRARGGPSGLAARAQRGLTLAELMVVVSIAAILLAIGIPNFQSMLAQNRATSAANQLQSSLQFARSTAVAQGLPVTICQADFDTTPASCSQKPNNRNWHEGWIVHQNGVVLREQRPLHRSITLTSIPQWIYSSTGTLFPGQTPDEFALRIEPNLVPDRTICMSLSGSSRIFQGDVSC